MAIHRKKMSIHRKLMAGCAVVVLTSGLAACGSSGSSDNSALNSLQETLDALQTAYGADDLTPDAIDQLQTDLDTAQADLDAANTRIGSDDEPMSLLGMLAAATGEVTGLQTEVMDLMTTLGDETNPDPASTRGMLAAKIAELTAAMDRIGSADDPASLLGMIEAEQAKVTQLTADLAAANTRIATLVGGTDPVQLDPIRMAAMTAKDAAAAAEMAADMAADEAEAAMANRATIQIGAVDSQGDAANSIDDAADARAAATTAMEEAGKALAAYDAATTAPNAMVAAAEQAKAEAAQMAAEDAQTAAEDARDEAVADSMVELKIAGTVKSVGDTAIDATDGSSVVRIGEGDDERTTHTGQIKSMTPMTTGDGADTGMDRVQDNPSMPGSQAFKHVQQVADRPFGIGKVVDSSDDAARLMIITHYASTNNVYVYNQGSAPDTGTKAGYISLDDGVPSNGDDMNNVRLKSEGTFYRAGTGTAGQLSAGEEVGAETKAVEVFSYVDPNASRNLADLKTYVVLTVESKSSGTTTYNYTNVDVEVTVMANGDSVAFETKVQAAIPEARKYEHIHFGVWAALKAPAASGAQNIADLGIGFVQNFSGGGMTGADMPNGGDATYSGSWAATVETANEDGNGAIVLESGDASVIADFDDGTIVADLDGLATLSGAVTGTGRNTFSGTKASDITHTSLDDEADFHGSFNGAFFGSRGAEAGGVFDFASDDGEGGAFRGAFGGKKDKKD